MPIPAPSQPSQTLLFLEWPLLLSLTQLRLANTEWLYFAAGGRKDHPSMPPQTPHMKSITFRIHKFSLEGLGKASSTREVRRAAASIAGCISLTAKCGRLTAGPCFFIATRPSAPGTKAHQHGPVQKLSYNFNITVGTSQDIVASLLWCCAISKRPHSCFFAIRRNSRTSFPFVLVVGKQADVAGL